MRHSLRLVMAVSADGFMSNHPNDDMSWLGRDDKTAFRILTGVGGVMGAGRATVQNMPPGLTGRTLLSLSRSGMTLGDFAERHPGAWLLGGPELARQALLQDMLCEVHLCRSDRAIWPRPVQGAWPDVVTPFLTGKAQVLYAWNLSMKTRLGDTVVERWVRT